MTRRRGVARDARRLEKTEKKSRAKARHYKTQATPERRQDGAMYRAPRQKNDMIRWLVNQRKKIEGATALRLLRPLIDL